jgi:thiamine monophosphate synthase
MTKTHALRGLYIVTPDWDDTARLLAVTEQALLGGAAIVQYRHKTADMVIAAATGHGFAGVVPSLWKTADHQRPSGFVYGN